MQKLATEKLKELNKESESISLTMLGSPAVEKGKVIDFNIKEYNLNHTFLLKRCEHKIDNQKHEVSLTLERIDV